MACNHKEHWDCKPKDKAIMDSLQDAIETLERISETDLTFTGGSSMKIDALECLQRVKIKLHESGIETGMNRIK